MSITVLAYHDQALVDQYNLKAAESTKATDTTSTQTTTSTTSATDSDFSTSLSQASESYTTDTTQDTTSLTDCPEDLYSIFEEAAQTFGVSVNLLTSIARAESNFNANAVSNAGAVGIMQLMPETAASLGVTNSYDAKDNIMGGAKYIAQLLEKYNGNTSLALAAYNAGSGNVDKYGGIPPFTETQNYVKKVLSYLNTENKADLKDSLTNFITANNISKDTLNALVDLLKLAETASSTISTSSTSGTSVATASSTATRQINVSVYSGSDDTNTTTDTASTITPIGSLITEPVTSEVTDSAEAASSNSHSDRESVSDPFATK